MSPLESRRQLLLAESDLNRVQLAEDLAALKAGVRTLTQRAQSLTALASTAAVLVTGLAACRRGEPGSNGAKPSWWRTLLKGAGLVSTLWLASRSQGHKRETK